jgi:cytochrome c oxidase subunit 4
MRHAPPPSLVLSWFALLALLGLTVLMAYQPLGAFNFPVAITIAAAKALIVAAVFMELRDRRGLTIAFAVAGVFWLSILLWLAGSDYFTRTEFPPPLH